MEHILNYVVLSQWYRETAAGGTGSTLSFQLDEGAESHRRGEGHANSDLNRFLSNKTKGHPRVPDSMDGWCMEQGKGIVQCMGHRNSVCVASSCDQRLSMYGWSLP